MNRLLLAGLVFAILTVMVYVGVAVRNRRRPELADGILVFIGAVSVFGAIRLIGFALTGQFAKIVSQSSDNSWWILSSEDAVFIVIGGLALAWVSVQTIWDTFAKLSKATPLQAANDSVAHDEERKQSSAASATKRRE